MGQLKPENVAKVVTFLRETRRQDDVSLEDVMGFAEVLAQSFQSMLNAKDVAIHSEIGEMAREIASMKSELADLRLGDVSNERIPAAGRELDAIVEATEEATNTIMTAAEEIMASDPADTEAYQALVGDKIVEIFEACAFQDITGQRISKVVTTLNHLDQRITRLVDRLKLMSISDAPAEETAAERRQRELILNGPQMKGEAISQDDIDALLR